MDISFAQLIIGAAVLCSVLSFGRFGRLMRRPEARQLGNQELEAVHDELDYLREQVALLQEENADLHDRMDAADRPLSEGRWKTPV